MLDNNSNEVLLLKVPLNIMEEFTRSYTQCDLITIQKDP